MRAARCCGGCRVSARADKVVMAPCDTAVDEYIAGLLDASVIVDSEPGPAQSPHVAHAVAAGDHAPAAAAIRSHGECVYRTFSVAGLQMLIQRGEIDSVGPMPKPVAESTKAVAWLLGTVMRDGHVCHMVDLARVIAPQADVHRSPGDAIYLVGGHWLLAVDALGEELTLAKEAVRWRENASSRPWLAGMASEPLCAVLDVVGLSGQLAQELQRDPA